MASIPGSVSMTTGSGGREGEGEGGRVRSSCTGYRLGCADFLCNSGAQGLEFRCASEPKNPCHDASSPVEQNRVRKAPVVIDRPHCPAAHEDRKRRPKLVGEAEHLAEIDVVGDRRNLEVGVAELG